MADPQFFNRTENMHHVIHAQVQYEFCIPILYSWIDHVLDVNQPFNWRAKIGAPLQNETRMRASILYPPQTCWCGPPVNGEYQH